MIKFKFQRETKNTCRYEELDEIPKIGVLYIQKWALKKQFDKYPKHLIVELREE